MFTLKINDTKLYVETFGDVKKPPIVLVHGSIIQSNGLGFWVGNGWAEKLAKNFYVIAYDRRNNGRYEGYSPKGTVKDHAEDLLALIDAMALDKPTVIGLSAGTYITGCALGIAPEKIGKVVLVVPHIEAKNGLTPAGVAFTNGGLTFEEACGFLTEERKQLYFDIFKRTSYAPTSGPEVMKAGMEGNSILMGEQTYTKEQKLEFSRMLGNFDNREAFRNAENPILVISGKYDDVCPPEAGREIADLAKNSKFVLMEHSGHMLAFEQPDEAIAEVEKFLL